MQSLRGPAAQVQNMAHKQEVSMSCVSSPSERTSAHRSPMVCSRRGSASNTAGNWLIHCLPTERDTQNNTLTSPQIVASTRSVRPGPYPALACPRAFDSPDKLADLRPLWPPLVRGTVLVSEERGQGSKHRSKGVQMRHRVTLNTSSRAMQRQNKAMPVP